MNTYSGLMKHKTVLTLVALVVIVILLGLFIASERLESYESTARVQVAEQQVLLTTIAETIARNGADAVTESIVQDCPIEDRLQFDSLLGQLDSGLAAAELRELDQLFTSCASFFAERKSLMVARFTREIEMYATQVELLDTLTVGDEYTDAQVEDWQQLLTEEQAQSEAFAELVVLQKQIIDALIAGQSAASPDVIAILNEVNETREALVFARTKAAQTRATLTAL